MPPGTRTRTTRNRPDEHQRLPFGVRSMAKMRSPTQERKLSAETARTGAVYLARGRLGQGAFRVLVTGAYDRANLPDPEFLKWHNESRFQK